MQDAYVFKVFIICSIETRTDLVVGKNTETTYSYAVYLRMWIIDMQTIIFLLNMQQISQTRVKMFHVIFINFVRSFA